MYVLFHDLLLAYFDQHLQGKPSYHKRRNTAKQWLLTLTRTPTRKDCLARMTGKGHGDYEPGAAQANMELTILRAALNWGRYHEVWEGGDPTVGMKKWKTGKREEVMKQQDVQKLLEYFNQATTDLEIRDRALFGLMLYSGCRPGEARKALVASITPYGEMGCWHKGRTKNKKTYEVPVPRQYMAWLADWLLIRPMRPNPYLFPGDKFGQPLTEDWAGARWRELSRHLGLHGLWNYDLRRSLASHMSNELNVTDAKIDAILGHEKTSSLGHYLHVSFDAMCGPIQAYADWLCGLKTIEPTRRIMPSVCLEQEVRA